MIHFVGPRTRVGQFEPILTSALFSLIRHNSEQQVFQRVISNSTGSANLKPEGFHIGLDTVLVL